MPTEKERISTYVSEEQKKCFKIIASCNNLTESKMLEKLVLQCISENSELLQKILPLTYLLHSVMPPRFVKYRFYAASDRFSYSSSVFRHSFPGRSTRKRVPTIFASAL